MGQQPKPRSFHYTPRYYDPEKDPDIRDRFQFTNSPYRRGGQGVIRNPWMLVALTLVVAALILTLRYGFVERMELNSVEITPQDAAQVDTPR